jgi:hypothetical protein
MAKKMTMRQAFDAVKNAFPEKHVIADYTLDRYPSCSGGQDKEGNHRRIYVEDSDIDFNDMGSTLNANQSSVFARTWYECAKPFLDLAKWIAAGRPAPEADPVENEQ